MTKKHSSAWLAWEKKLTRAEEQQRFMRNFIRPAQFPPVPNDMSSENSQNFEDYKYPDINPRRQVVAIRFPRDCPYDPPVARKRIQKVMKLRGLKPISPRVYTTSTAQFMEAIPTDGGRPTSDNERSE